MHTKTAAILAAAVTMGAVSATAAAQSAPTCSFNAGTATVTVTVDVWAARVRADAATGEIQLNGVACGGATVTNTDSILLNGGLLNDVVSLAGSFTPGLTPESDGASEIEIVAALRYSTNYLQINLTSANDRLVFAAGGVDVGEDGDADITVVGELSLHRIEVYGKAGNDTLDGRGYVGNVYFFGGPGDDRLFGSAGPDSLHGDGGNDTIFGGSGNDWLYSDAGDDELYGGPGNDSFGASSWTVPAEVTADGRDAMYGGEGTDSVFYYPRLGHVTVILNNGLADDGEEGESDLVEGMENVTGGRGGNLIVGTDSPNGLVGGPGVDEIYAGGGDDVIHAWAGQDILVGDAGADRLFGGAGPDSIDGGGGGDELHGGDANDIITSGSGHDEIFGDDGDDTIYNAGDEMSDNVDCGNGTDDAEDDPLDTFTGCEL